MADLFRLSASEAAARIREGELTSEALVRSCLERIDSRESQVKAWVHLDRDFALAQARECDKSANRGPTSRSSIRGQGHHGHGRPAHRVRIAHLQRQPSYGGRGVRRTEPRCRRRAFGQDGDDRVCQSISIGKHDQSAQPRAYAWRFLQRLRRRGRRFHGAAGLWHPDGRIGDPSGSVLRLRRLQTELRRSEHPGREAEHRVLRHRGAFRSRCRRPRSVSRRGYRIRSETSGRHSSEPTQDRLLPHVLGPRGGVYENFSRRGGKHVSQGRSEGRRLRSRQAV